MAKYINKYGNLAEYNADGSRPSDSSVVSVAGTTPVIDGVNVIAPFKCAQKHDHAFFDKEIGDKVVIRGGTLKTALLDSERFVNLRNVCIGTIFGHLIFVSYDQLPAERYATGDEWTVSGFNMAAAGSATLVVKTYGAAAANTYTVNLSWSAGDSIDSIVNAIKAVSGLTTYAEVMKVGSATVGIIVHGYSTGMGVSVTDGNVVAERTHQGYQARYYDGASLPYGTQILRHNGVLAGSAFACFDTFYDYYKTNGVQVASTIGGDTVRQSAFTADVNPDLYSQFNGNYDAYMAAQFDAIRTEFPTTRSGLADMAIGTECSDTLAKVKHTRFDGVEVYDFPNAHSAYLNGVTVDGYTTGFEPGTGHLGGLAEAQLLFSQIKRGYGDDLNKSILAGGGTRVSNTTTIRLAFQSGSDAAWIFYGSYGSLNGGYARIATYYARVFRAFKVDSLS